MADMSDAKEAQPNNDRKPWEQRSDENAADFAAFQAYLHLPAPRGASGLAKSVGLPTRSLDRKRSKYDWVKRAQAYDQWKIQQAVALAEATENPYQRMLNQAAARAQNLHDAAQKLLLMANRSLDHAERQYQKALVADKDATPPVPSTALVSAIRGASDCMDKASEAQALALGISDVLQMRQEGAGA